MTSEQLIPPSLLFRFAVPCRACDERWNNTRGVALNESHRLPNLGELDQQPNFADVRAGWSKDGLMFTVDVSGKQQSLWCRPTQLTESDGFQVWIDTRNTHNVHRANRFCHWFLFLPTGGGPGREDPIATMLKINRSKEDPKTMNQAALKVLSKKKVGGYRLSVWIPGSALTGWGPDEHRKLGFNYAVVDRELGWQTLSIGPEFPIAEDPSLWQTIDLTV